ncbi:MAG: hypothetical protein JXA93_24120 [Anaerolineae bacterium]|nr:hypothetical protein [Anaerolineae bacterium]
MLSRGLSCWRLIAIGFVLVLFGFVVPFLMCIQVMAPSFALCFLSFSASVTGVLLGIIGVSEYSEICF